MHNLGSTGHQAKFPKSKEKIAILMSWTGELEQREPLQWRKFRPVLRTIEQQTSISQSAQYPLWQDIAAPAWCRAARGQASKGTQ